MRKRVERVFKLAKGFRGRSRNCYRIAKPRVDKALQYAYVGRKLKKRDARKLWIQQINAGVRQHGIKYSGFINALHATNIDLNRKILAQLSQTEPVSFKAVAEFVKREKLIPLTEAKRWYDDDVEYCIAWCLTLMWQRRERCRSAQVDVLTHSVDSSNGNNTLLSG